MYTQIQRLLEKRVLLLDGAMGSFIKSFNLADDIFKGDVFKNHVCPLSDDCEILNISQPDIISNIHKQYLEAGSDIITTNTFNANAISQNIFLANDFVYKMNKDGATIAKNMATNYSSFNKPRFVAGSVGPSHYSLSANKSLNKNIFTHYTYDDLVNAFSEQIRGLLDGEVDLLLIETAFDIINLKAALSAALMELKTRSSSLPLMVSLTIDKEGKIFSGHSLPEVAAFLSDYPIFSVGINCFSDIDRVIPFISYLNNFKISIYPNAGFPDVDGNYFYTPISFAEAIAKCLKKNTISIVGGCCGTTPDHISALYDIIKSNNHNY